MKQLLLTLFICASVSCWGAGAVCLSRGGMSASVLEYGARVQSLVVGGHDVVLGFDDAADYERVKQNFGAVVGRYIGRILGGRLPLDGEVHQLQTGINGDCSHGGTPGFSQKRWTVVAACDTAATLRLVSPDGENGFPGELTLDVTYTLTADSALRIDYAATTTRPTVLNPSNHSFFNLTGDLAMPVLDEMVWVDADSIALYDAHKRVTGEMGTVQGMPYDFRTPRRIGQYIDVANAQLLVTKGYDNCYRLNTAGDLRRPAARLTDSGTGLTMTVYTTEPALQLYTANGHNGSIRGKDGKAYPRRNAVCFETMHFPDSPNKPQWPTTVLRPGETFRSTTIYKFAVVE